MIASELMTKDPVTVQADTPVKAALMILDEHNITSLPVVGSDGRITGIVSEADLIRELVEPDPRSREIPFEERHDDRPHWVGDVMTTHAITVRSDTDVADAVELATSTGVKSLPVVDDAGRVVGVLSRRDVVRKLARADELLEKDIDALLVSAGERNWLVDVHDGTAEIAGPATAHERVVARVLAESVPGVHEVRISPTRPW